MRKNRWVAFLALNAMAAVAVGGLFAHAQSQAQPTIAPIESPNVVQKGLSCTDPDA